MKNNYYEDRYISPEEIEEFVLGKFEEAEEHHERFSEFHIGEFIGYSPKGKDRFSEVLNAVIIIKNGTDIVSLRVVDGKLIGDHPHEFYLVYKSGKYLVCGLCLNDKETFIKISEKDDLALDNDITVYIEIHHSGGIFNLYFAPDEEHFTENTVIGTDTELYTIAKLTKRFIRLPSNFRSPSKENDESEEEA